MERVNTRNGLWIDYRLVVVSEVASDLRSTVDLRRVLELAAAAAGLSLDVVADDSAIDYEKTHLSECAWPPTSWYGDSTAALDVTRDESPIELRWLV